MYAILTSSNIVYVNYPATHVGEGIVLVEDVCIVIPWKFRPPLSFTEGCGKSCTAVFPLVSPDVKTLQSFYYNLHINFVYQQPSHSIHN